MIRPVSSNTMDYGPVCNHIVSVLRYLQAKETLQKGSEHLLLTSGMSGITHLRTMPKREKWKEKPAYNEDQYNFEDALLVGGIDDHALKARRQG